MENEEKELKAIEERELIMTEEYIDKNNPEYFENNENENKENKKYDESRIYYVYEHIRLDNMTCFYVGKGKGDRAYEINRNDFHDNISNSYGHAVVIVKDNLNEKEAFELERDTIEDYIFTFGYGIDIDGYKNRENNEFLTNLTFGGEGFSGRKHSEETKLKMSESQKGKHLSDESKLKMSEAQKGENNPMYGKHHSEETKLKMSESQKGKHHSDEAKRKNSEAHKGEKNPMYGKHHSDESKLKMSESQKGKHLSDESKLKMSESHSKKVICITTGKTFNSLKEASNCYNVAISNISRCCGGTRKSAGKLKNGMRLKWKYSENDDDNDLKVV